MGSRWTRVTLVYAVALILISAIVCAITLFGPGSTVSRLAALLLVGVGALLCESMLRRGSRGLNSIPRHSKVLAVGITIAVVLGVLFYDLMMK